MPVVPDAVFPGETPDPNRPPRPPQADPYVPTLPKIKKKDTYGLAGQRYITPQALPDAVDQYEAYFYDGMIDPQGRVLNAVDRNTLTYGKPRDASPEYWKYLDRLNEWATQYPTADPRVWVPLAAKGIKAGSLIANQIVATDTQRLANLGAYGSKTEASDNSAKDPKPQDDGGDPSFMAQFWDSLFGGSGIKQGAETVTAPIGNAFEATTDFVGNAADATIGAAWDKSGADSAAQAIHLDDAVNKGMSDFKGAVRTAFAAASMPVQAVTGGFAANISADVEKGDWGQALLNTAGILPGVEAIYVGLENLTGTQFYRNGGQNQTNWSQTDMGQMILDIFGQGRGEQFGQYNDAPGLQADTGSGWFIGQKGVDETPSSDPNAPSTVAQWQRQARLNANTVVDRQELTGKDLRNFRKIAKMQDIEEAMAWAQKQGFRWDPVEKSLFRPAQGFTLGRATGLAMGLDPYSSAYNTMSGAIDFATNLFGDPINYIPGGAIKAGFQAARGGGKIVKGAEGAASIFARQEEVLKNLDETAALLERGMSVADIERSTGGKIRLLKNAPESTGYTTRDVPAQELDSLIGDMIDSGRAPNRTEAVNELLADGYTWEVARDLPAEVMDPATLQARLAEGATIADLLKETGGFASSRKAMDYFSTEQGWAVTNALAAEKESATILLKSGGKFSPATASRLAKAETPNDVMEVLAPLLGGRVKYQNDLAMFADGEFMPSYNIGYKLWKASDLNGLKEAFINHVPGMSFMPGKFAVTDNLDDVVKQWTRFGRVTSTKILKDEGVIKALSRLIDTADMSGPAARAARYQAQYGIGGRKVLVDSEGRVLQDHNEVRVALDEGATEEQILSQFPPGSQFVEGKDGVLQAIVNHLVGAGKLADTDFARSLTKVWGADDYHFRRYAQDGQGGNWVAPWNKNGVGRNEPFLEADVLGRLSLMPDIDLLRKHISRWGHIADQHALEGGLEGKASRAALVLDDLMTTGMYRWKQVVLMAGGLRLPIYTFRALADTHMTIAMSGGSSILRSPGDLLGLILTSAVRQAEKGDNPAMLRRDRLARATASNPLVRMLWRDDLTADVNGNPWVKILDDVANGNIPDQDEAYRFFSSLNAQAGERGSLGQDVYYSGPERKPYTANRDDKADWIMYSDQLADEMWRLSQSPTAQKIAQATADGDQFGSIVDWFMQSREAGAAVYRELSPEARALALTRDGAESIVRSIGEYMLKVTAGDQDLIRVIARRGRHTVVEKAADGSDIRRVKSMLTTNARQGDRRVSNEFRDLLKEKADAQRANPGGPQFMQQLVTTKANAGAKGLWDAKMRSFFHIAGKWEDIYAREPFYRERYFAHVKDTADLLLPTEKAALVADLRAKGSGHLADQIERMPGSGHFTRKELDDVASWRAAQDITDVAYDAANRREWAYALRLLSPFVQAAVNGMYRWAKAAVQNPESTYRLLKGIHFLSGTDSAFINDYLATSAPDGSAFIYEDPNGVRRIGLPGMGLLSSLMGMPEDVAGNFSFGASSLNFAFPGYERAALAADAGYTSESRGIAKALFPGFGPIVSLSLSAISDGTSEWARDYLMPYGAPGQGWQNQIKLLMPGTISRLLNVIAPSPEEERRDGARVLQFYAMIAKEEGGLVNMTQAEQRSALERAKGLARSFKAMEAISNLGSPGALSAEVLYKNPGDVPDHFIYAQQVGDIYQKYLTSRGYNYAEAEAAFVNDVGLETLLLTGPSGFDTDAAPPTRGAMAVRQTYKEGYERYAPVLASLLTSKDGSEFDLGLYSIQAGYGERIQLPIEQRVDLANERVLDYIFTRQVLKIADSNATELEKSIATSATRAQLQKLGWNGPSQGRTMEDRQNQYDLMMQAAKDPEMVPFIGKQTSASIIAYLTARREVMRDLRGQGTSGDLANLSFDAHPELASLWAFGESLTHKDPGFRVIWWKTFRSEVMPDEEK